MGRLFGGAGKGCRLLVACNLGACLVRHRGSLLCRRVVLWLVFEDEMWLDGWSVEAVAVDIALVVVSM
jgi:hypothetical protein